LHEQPKITNSKGNSTSLETQQSNTKDRHDSGQELNTSQCYTNETVEQWNDKNTQRAKEGSLYK